MRQRLAGLIATGGLVFAVAGCGETTNTNANMNANANANVNANRAATTNQNANVATRTEPTREEYDRDRDRYMREAREAGRTIGSGVNDGWLWVKARWELTTAEDLRESTIDVDVENDVVTLSGTVGNSEQRKRAEAIVRAIEGVKDVRNNLKVAAES